MKKWKKQKVWGCKPEKFPAKMCKRSDRGKCLVHKRGYVLAYVENGSN